MIFKQLYAFFFILQAPTPLPSHRGGVLFLQRVREAMVYQMTLSPFQTKVLGTLLVKSWLFIVLGGQ
jgi:hypothetical protein